MTAPASMTVLGLTGSIGMGKTTTAQLFREAGIPVWDADDAVHRLYARSGAAVPKIAALCPDAIDAGAVSRERLKAAIAADPRLLARIEEVVHPLVAADRAAFLDQARADGADIVLLDTPLLFETGADAIVDAVLVVTISAEEQRRRVLSRPGMTEDGFRHLLSRQLPDAEKRARADYIIETADMDSARRGVLAVLQAIRSKAHA